ncbi:MAG: aspartyl protease family protein [Phycisphaerae bacterium]|nr:aspartyl protease family protein [Phycisphaerae bacterium]
MFKRLICVLTFAFPPVFASGHLEHSELPILRANSKIMDVHDGDRLHKGDWSADPSIPLDEFVVPRSAEPRTVTFFTDVEAKSFVIAPGGVTDFIILLNGTDQCRTRISMRAMSARRSDGTPTGSVTIPITFRKGKPHIEGRINGSQSLNLLFDTGANTTAVYPSARDKGVTLAFDGSLANAGTGGSVTRQTSSDNRLDVGGLYWEHESVLSIEKQADDADGIVGYNVFEDKVVELDNDRMVIVIHDSLPEHAAAYTRVDMPFIASLTAVEGSLVNGSVRATGPMVIDTGGNGTLIVNRPFIEQNGLRAGLQLIGSSRSGGVGPAQIRNEVVRAPGLEIAGFTLPDVPVNVPVSDDAARVAAVATETPRGLLCMDVLSRFNMFFDYRRNQAYFKPNTRFVGPFKDRTSGPPVGMTLAVIAGVLGASFVAVKTIRGRRQRRAGLVMTSKPGPA